MISVFHTPYGWRWELHHDGFYDSGYTRLRVDSWYAAGRSLLALVILRSIFFVCRWVIRRIQTMKKMGVLANREFMVPW